MVFFTQIGDLSGEGGPSIEGYFKSVANFLRTLWACASIDFEEGHLTMSIASKKG